MLPVIFGFMTLFLLSQLLVALQDGTWSVLLVPFVVSAFMVWGTRQLFRNAKAMDAAWSSRPATADDAALFRVTTDAAASIGLPLDSMAHVRLGKEVPESLRAVYADGSGVFLERAMQRDVFVRMCFRSWFDDETLELVTSSMGLKPTDSDTITHQCGGSLADVYAAHRDNLAALQAKGHTLSVQKPYWYMAERFDRRQAKNLTIGSYLCTIVLPRLSDLQPVAQRA